MRDGELKKKFKKASYIITSVTWAQFQERQMYGNEGGSLYIKI